MKTLEELGTLVRDTFSGEPVEFRPCAFCDEGLDCIRVIARDCSVVEERVNERVTVLIDSYYPGPGRRQYVGFTIKGARHFCKQRGWDTKRSIGMVEFLDAVFASSPELVMEWFMEIVARPLVREEKIESVELPDGALSTV